MEGADSGDGFPIVGVESGVGPVLSLAPLSLSSGTFMTDGTVGVMGLILDPSSSSMVAVDVALG